MADVNPFIFGNLKKKIFVQCLQSLSKKIERHAADTIVSWPNPKQWVIVEWYLNQWRWLFDTRSKLWISSPSLVLNFIHSTGYCDTMNVVMEIFDNDMGIWHICVIYEAWTLHLPCFKRKFGPSSCQIVVVIYLKWIVCLSKIILPLYLSQQILCAC